jgi:hypothetical protein
MRYHFLAPSLLLTIASACGDPCLPTVLADTSVIAADEDCVPDGTTGEGASTDGASTDGASSGVSVTSTTADESTGAPAPNPLTCVSVPEAGKFWGPCLNGTCVEGACEESAGTSICVPGCTEDPCNIRVCFPGVCNDKWQCVGPCDGPEDCAPGMVCNDLGHCAWAGE